MESLASNKRYIKLLIAPIVLCFVLALNLSEDLNYSFELNFKDVSPETHVSLMKLFVVMITINYVMERFIKFLKYKKVYDYIWEHFFKKIYIIIKLTIYCYQTNLLIINMHFIVNRTNKSLILIYFNKILQN